MAKPQVTLYFDLLSPFSYIAFHILKLDLPHFQDLYNKVHPSPPSRSLPTMPEHTPTRRQKYNPPPSPSTNMFLKINQEPNKGGKDKSAWLNNQRLYWSRRLNLPMCKTTPQGFPFPTVEIQPVLCVISERFP
ncbi:uncharacterized protein BDW43DRAFT_305686 [Aspergillus alliaceus]|uniref:uncharacterized protein n=1 Tax=Petromyces alliaceus TaxID=209559 RepID=UPI0012A4D335|nr:uncharacterized protein BDW43DRAFT_305686 [Aspergillus alliaceus]KAB8238784.1 hypothetical protein BDW43DRAFT_305686 [Aspergillus alliaceus]